MKWPDSGHVLKAVPTGLPEVRAEAERRMRSASGGGRLQAAWGSWHWAASAVTEAQVLRGCPLASASPAAQGGVGRGQRCALSLTRSHVCPAARCPSAPLSRKTRGPQTAPHMPSCELRESLSEPRFPCLSTGL